jgi:nitroreductase
MDIYEAIKTRRSVRSYQSKSVPKEVLLKVMEAARLAPSANNQQPWRFVLATDPVIIKQLGNAARQNFVGEAPAILTGVALRTDHTMRCGIISYPVDLAIAMEHVALAAADEGLGTCWIGSFGQAEVKRVLNIPDPYIVVGLMPIGYPADEGPAIKNRKPLEDIVSFNRF